MSTYLVFLYIVAFGLWLLCIHREGGTGIGARFIYLFSLISQFLIGPPLYYLSGLMEADPSYAELLPAVELALLAMIGFVAGGYIAVPYLTGHRLHMATIWRPFLMPARLTIQWEAAKHLVVLGSLSLLLVPIMFRVPTLRAIWSQINLLIEAGLIMMCLNAILTRNRSRLWIMWSLLALTGFFRVVMSGFLGGTMLTGLYLLSLVLMSHRIRLLSWVWFILAAYLALIPYGLWMNSRGKLREAIKRDAPLSERIDIFFEEMGSPNLFSLADPEDVKSIQVRVDFSRLLAAALEHTPAREPYAAGGSIVESTFMALIPRVFWPDKPLNLGGTAFVSRYTGIKFGTDVSVGVNYVFELYVNFGPVGTIIGLFLLGVLMGMLEHLYFRWAPLNLAYEWGILLCMWSMCMFADRVCFLVMAMPLALFVAWFTMRIFRTMGWRYRLSLTSPRPVIRQPVQSDRRAKV